MSSRITRPAMRSVQTLRTYATQAPPPPFTSSVINNTPTESSHHAGTVDGSSPAASTSNPIASKPNRLYPMRKAFLFDYYGHLLKTSPMFLVFEFDNLSVQDWSKLRNMIQKIKLPPPPSPPSQSTQSSSASASSSGKGSKSKSKKAKAAEVLPVDTKASLTVIRTGVFSASASKHAPSSVLEPWLTGQRAVLHSEYLSPPYLKEVLATVKRGIRQSQREGDGKQPALNLVVGLIENRLMPAKEVEELAKLPDMQTLRGQLVGTMEMPGRSVLGLLSQAGGGGLLRTLQGLEQDLKAKEETTE